MSRGGLGANESRADIRFGDVRDLLSVMEVVRGVKPAWIFHLAGESSVAKSWREPESTIRDSVSGLCPLLEAVRTVAPAARVLVVGSIEEFGPLASASPLTEFSAEDPVSPYGLGKSLAGRIASWYASKFGLAVMRVRPVNHTGPGQDLRFFIPSVIAQIAKQKGHGTRCVVRVGAVEVEREFLDVRDVVDGYLKAMQLGEPGVAYLLGSGTPLPLREILSKAAGLAGVELELVRDESRVRPSDPGKVWTDSRWTRERLGWEPMIPIEDTLREMLAAFSEIRTAGTDP